MILEQHALTSVVISRTTSCQWWPPINMHFRKLIMKFACVVFHTKSYFCDSIISQVYIPVSYANKICSYPCLERTSLQLHLYKSFKPATCCCRITFAVFGWRSCTEVQGAPMAANNLYHHCTYASLSTSSRNQGCHISSKFCRDQPWLSSSLHKCLAMDGSGMPLSFQLT